MNIFKFFRKKENIKECHSFSAEKGLELAIIDLIKSTGLLIDARVEKEPKPCAMLLKCSSLLLSLAEGDSEYDRRFCEIRASLEKYYDSSIMQVVQEFVVNILEVENEFLKFRKEYDSEQLDKFVMENAKEEASTGIELLCYKLSLNLNDVVTTNELSSESNEKKTTRFIKTIETGVDLGIELLELIRKRYVFNSTILFDCVFFDMILKKDLNADISEYSAETMKLRSELIEIIKGKKLMWLNQVENVDCRKQVELAIEKLLPIAYKSLLLYLYEKILGGPNALLNEKYVLDYGDVEGDTLRYAFYKFLKVPGIEREFTKERIISELEQMDVNIS